MASFGQARSRLAAALAAVIGAVVHDDEHPGRVLVLRPAHDLVHQVHERGDAGGVRGGGEHFPGVHVERGQQGQGAVADVFVLDSRGLAGRGRGGGVAVSAGLDGRLGVHRQDPVARRQPYALVVPLVQVEDDRCPGGEVRVAGEDPRLIPPGLDRVLGQDPQHRGRRELAWASPALMISVAARGPVQRDSGTPVVAGTWQVASATTAARVSSLIRLGRPDRGRSFSPSSPRAANRPRHLRAVSTLTSRSRAMQALARPRAADSTICARSRSPVRRLRPPDAFLQGGARSAGTQHDRHSEARSSGMAAPGVRSQRRNPLPGTRS